MHRLLAVILAGGMGERLSVLSQDRAKPAVPFAGKYRMIDFTLSNCVNSDIHNIIVLTQYEPVSLTAHIGVGTPWGLDAPNRKILLLQPYLAREAGRDWYKGTADAVYQNLNRIEHEDADEILILSGDHVYNMDYAKMLEFHRTNGADVTIAVTPMPSAELFRLGTVAMDDKGRVTSFEEKTPNPKNNLASMGVYIFNLKHLREWLEAIRVRNDFGRDVLPRLARTHKLYGFLFQGYWRDIGTLDSYWQANMEVLVNYRELLVKPGWPVMTRERGLPPTKLGHHASVTESLLPNGCFIDGTIERSVISPGVQVARGAAIRDSIIMDDTVIGENSFIDRAIIDKDVKVAENCLIGAGEDNPPNRLNPENLRSGLTIIGKRAEIPAGYKIGRNCIVYENLNVRQLPSGGVKSGETVKPRVPSRVED